VAGHAAVGGIQVRLVFLQKLVLSGQNQFAALKQLPPLSFDELAVARQGPSNLETLTFHDSLCTIDVPLNGGAIQRFGPQRPIPLGDQ